MPPPKNRQSILAEKAGDTFCHDFNAVASKQLVLGNLIIPGFDQDSNQ